MKVSCQALRMTSAIVGPLIIVAVIVALFFWATSTPIVIGNYVTLEFRGLTAGLAVILAIPGGWLFASGRLL